MSPIVYELGLVIVALVAFAVWQTVTLRRDMRITRAAREARETREAGARAGHADCSVESDAIPAAHRTTEKRP